MRAEDERRAGLDFHSYFLGGSSRRGDNTAQQHTLSHRTTHGVGAGDESRKRNLFTNTRALCSKIQEDRIWFLPLMRVPVTSLCRDRANLTSPCLQRLAHPVILAVTRDKAGSAEPQAAPSSERLRCQLLPLSSLWWSGSARRRRACSLRCVAFRPADLEGERKEKKNRNGDLPVLSLPHCSSSSVFFMPLVNVTELVTAWGVYALRKREED